MDYNEYIKKMTLESKQLSSKLKNIVINQIYNKAFLEFKKRIFEQGLDEDNNKIGIYSEHKIRVSKSKLINKSSFITVNPKNKTMILQNGYKELRKIQNLEYKFVNLSYSGELANSIRYQIDEDSYTIGFIDPKNSKIGRSLEKKYNKSIFKFSEKEIEDIKQKILETVKDNLL